MVVRPMMKEKPLKMINTKMVRTPTLPALRKPKDLAVLWKGQPLQAARVP